jgi:O-antigen ligase
MEVSEEYTPASLLLAGVCLFLPLLILPDSVSFSFDSLPKAVLLYLAAAIVLLLPGVFGRSVGNLLATTAGKLFLLFALVTTISLVSSSVNSVDPELSFFGTRWRHFGALSQSSVLAVGIAAAGVFSKSRPALFFSLRMFSLGGLFAALYALLQFFGIDPLLDPSLYTLTSALHVTRPPSSLGHPGYLAGFEAMVFFVALALRQREARRSWRFVLIMCAALAVVAILISGTRAAALAVLLGVPVFLAMRGMRAVHLRALGVLLVSSLALFGLLLLAPQGGGLQQRLRQWTQDFGGPRLLVWKDTLPLIGERALTGSGPETFTVAFPKFESPELYRRYPDFQQESPHNVLLDAAEGQGIPGLLALLLGAALAGWCAWKTSEKNKHVASILVAGMVACLIFHQFFAFTLPTYFAFVLMMSALVALHGSEKPKTPEMTRRVSVPMGLCGALVGIVLLTSAVQESVTDHAFARVDSLLNQGNVAGAVEQYHRARHWRMIGQPPDLWYSQQMAWAAQALPAGALQQLARAEALEASRNAVQDPGEDRITAAYHRAILCASTGQQQEAEIVARRISSDAPNWYQAHWILSRLLVQSGRVEDGQREADLALGLVGDTKPEVREKINNYYQALVLFQKKKSLE